MDGVGTFICGFYFVESLFFREIIFFGEYEGWPGSLWACDNIMYMSNLGRRGTAAFLTEQEGRAGGYCGTGLTPAPEEETDLKSGQEG